MTGGLFYCAGFVRECISKEKKLHRGLWGHPEITEYLYIIKVKLIYIYTKLRWNKNLLI